MGYKYTEKEKENKRLYRQKHREKILLYLRKYYKSHKEERAKNDRIYYEKNRVEISLKGKEYRKKNKRSILERNKEYANRMRRTNVQFKLRTILRSRLGDSLRGNWKNGSAVRDLGCTIPELKFYLEGKFTDGMTWENWTNDGWHIDHVIPLSFFDLSDREQFLKACHYTNLQPLWAVENISKNNKIVK